MNTPSRAVLKAFGLSASAHAKRFKGGQGSTFLVEDMVLKPAFGVNEANWAAEVYNSIEQTGFCVPRPMPANANGWIYDGWTAWEYLEGVTLSGEKYKDRLLASQAFHQALEKYPRPAFLDKRDDAWSQADRIVWENATWQAHPNIAELYNTLKSYTKLLDLPEQIIHGDIAGNMLYTSLKTIAIIDFSPYWRPAAYAEALLCVDAIMWEQAPWSIINIKEVDDTFIQLMLRAVMRRLVEVDRHYHLQGLSESYLDQVTKYENFIKKFKAYIDCQ